MKKVISLVLSACLFLSIQGQISYADAKNDLIIINKHTNQLAFFHNGERVKTYSVATGRTNSLTPEGTFKIVNKIKNRPYYKKKIAGGSPKNPLGDRWLGINVRGTEGTTYAIHGNNNENSIGKYVSSGCIRMHNKDVRSLYSIVEVNTPVIITNTKKSFNDIAESKGYTLHTKVVPFKKVITTLQASKLYNQPNPKNATGSTINPQSLQAYEKAGNFIKVKTWKGQKWIYAPQYIEGKRVRLDALITIQSQTNVYKRPLDNLKPIGTIKPKKVFAYEQIGKWYKVSGTNGPVYIKPVKVSKK